MTVKVYTLQNCGYCKVAKELLAFKEVAYEEVKVPEQMTTREFTTKYPNTKTFPLILDENDDKIGGFRDLQEWLLARENKQFLTEDIKGLSI